jgi:hypothetical protein
VGGNVKPGLVGFTALLFGAALIGMVINLTADKVLDKEEWLDRFPPPGRWHDEDYWKLQAVKEAVTLAAEPKVTHIIRNHSDNVYSAKSFIQHAYPAVQKQQNSNVLTGLRYEFLVVKVLRVFLLLVVGLYVLMILRAGWVIIEKRKFRDRWLGLLLATILTLCLYVLLMWLWTQQSRRYYKKLVHSYIVLAASEDNSLLATSLERGWAAKAWDSINDACSLTVTNPVKHFGACDGSNGISTGPRHFVAASDDNNIILLFETDGARSKPLLDLNSWLGFSPHNGKFRECDLEGAARIGDRIFWIGSHGRNNEEEERKERQVFFATAITGSGENTGLQPVGQPYKELLRDLISHGNLHGLDFAEAAKKAPKENGALNIESICALGQTLYIGFRNPIPAGKALILPMTNPAEVVEKGTPAKFGDPILLDLEGLGIRDMVWWRDAFLIVAGDYRIASEPGAKPPKLFLWEGADKQPRALQVKLGDLNPEAAILFEDDDSGKLLLLSDDGNQKVGAGKMKDLEPSARWFRSVWIEKPH